LPILEGAALGREPFFIPPPCLFFVDLSIAVRTSCPPDSVSFVVARRGTHFLSRSFSPEEPVASPLVTDFPFFVLVLTLPFRPQAAHAAHLLPFCVSYEVKAAHSLSLVCPSKEPVSDTDALFS